MKVLFITAAVLLVGATGAPAGISIPFLTLENGNIGVRFGGYHASAGLGGLLSGDVTKGGLHAEAGTPFGQSAGAGLGGILGPNGRVAEGGLYAGASAGGGVEAAAGLGGATSNSGSTGASFAAASSGASSGAYIRKTGYKGNVGIVSAQPQKEIIERTVIPNYVEKTVQVPSYVEKTVRVPTVVEKRVRVPVAPTVIEKTVNAAPVADGIHIQTVPSAKHSIKISSRGHHDGRSKVKIVEKERVQPGSSVVVTKYNGVGGSDGSLFAGTDGYGSGFSRGEYSSSKSASVTASASPQLFNDIFNIPISTLGAVNRLLNGIAGGTSATGSLAVSKSYAGTY